MNSRSCWVRKKVQEKEKKKLQTTWNFYKNKQNHVNMTKSNTKQKKALHKQNTARTYKKAYFFRARKRSRLLIYSALLFCSDGFQTPARNIYSLGPEHQSSPKLS